MTRNPDPPEVVAAARADAPAPRARRPGPPGRYVGGGPRDELAYAVQRLTTAWAVDCGRRVVGRKIGLTSLAVQHQLGVGQPDFGVLMDDMAVPNGGEVPFGRLLQPKVEAELAFILGADLTSRAHSPDAVLDAVDRVVPALEMVDSRIADWDITFADTVADNGSSGLFVLGSGGVPPERVALAQVRMTLDRNGERVATGTGADCLGSPLNAAVWLADTLSALGEPLRAGDVVLTGALGPMAAARPGDVFEAHVTGFAPVRVGFAKSPR